MKIVILVEGKTETAFKPFLLRFLYTRLHGNMPKLDFHPYNGRIPTDDKLKRIVINHFAGKTPADHVIALTDVYTGTVPPEFLSAGDAKHKMRKWVGPEARFHPHAAQHDFEAWLLPYWPTIQKLAGHNKSAPGKKPETVNHDHPPAHHIADIYESGNRKDSYNKPRDAKTILEKNDLNVAIGQCPELKSFINTILHACGAEIIP